MLLEDKIWVAQGDNPCYLLLNQANRHGLIAGASGTGKTVTLKVLAEAFSAAGVPTWKGEEESGVPQPGTLMFEVDGVSDEGYQAHGKRPGGPGRAGCRSL